MTYHRWNGGTVCERCGVETTPDDQGRPISPGPCGEGGKRPSRKRPHNWTSLPSRSDDRTLWRCVYCEAEAETDASKNSPGSHPIVHTFYRDKGGVWAEVTRIPACREETRVPVTARALIRNNDHLTATELGLLLGECAGTAYSWRRRCTLTRKEAR